MKAKTLRHNLEWTWRRSRTHVDRSCYRHQCHLCNRMMTKARSKYLADGISENSYNPRRLWNSINTILHRIPPPALPEFTSVISLCDQFSKYVVSVPNFRIKYTIVYQCKNQTEIRSKMNVFERATACLTCVRPLLRKKSLPKNKLKNYRPVSNLSFISKILEKVAARLQAHIKISIYLIHYNQPTGNIILQNQRY